jgi:hypothetical protein
MRTSIVPQAAPIGSTGDAATLQFPAENDDNIYIFDTGTQRYKESYSYVDFLGGWGSANTDDPGGQGPTIPVAAGFFLQMAPTATATAWTRTFSVNP